MFVALFRFLRGYLRIRIIGYSPERFINLCSRNHIYLWNLTPCEHAYELYLSVRGFRKIKPIMKKTKTRVKIIERRGLPFFLHRHRKRKIFFIGILFCTFAIYMMSLYLWNIDIRGNLTRTDETILEYLDTRNIRHGMKISNINCSRIVKDIRKEFDDIIWVSASIQGTRLIIQVKENTDKTYDGEEVKQSEAPIDLVAAKDGVITEIITRNGVPQIHEKDEVKAGDLLVKGSVEVLNDAGEVTGYQYKHSDADIYAQTTISYEDSMPLTYEEKIYSKVPKDNTDKVKSYLRIGNYSISLGSLKHNYEHWEEFNEEHQIKIGEHFELPIFYGTKTVRQYNPVKKNYSDGELKVRLTDRFDRFCEELKKKGVVILENNVKIYKEQGIATARGNLTVIEEIGTEQAGTVTEIETEEGNPSDGNTGNAN